MTTAPFPQPQYISIDNVSPLLSADKVGIGAGSNNIPTDTANILIAQGEDFVLQDLSPYYVVEPTLLTMYDEPWTLLPSVTYTYLYKMFTYKACVELLGNFISRNTDMQGKTLSYSQNWYEAEYQKFLNRLDAKLPNGSYKYQLIGLATINDGIPRRVDSYARTGNLGANNYTDNQVTNPQFNYNNIGYVNRQGGYPNYPFWKN